MIFDELDEFQRDVKSLVKKYRTLNEDIEVVRRVLEIYPDPRPPFSFRLESLEIQTCVIKVKKIACRALKGRGVNSGLRLVYAYFKEEQRIILVEIYHKNDTAMEDRLRIKENFK
ncbi:MAG TPA: hypothetical protein DC042_12700 [Bacteroidales bacterium]|nr:hypothetical protein [Bacteroidales bacterium]